MTQNLQQQPSPEPGVVGTRKIDVESIDLVELHFERPETKIPAEKLEGEGPVGVNFHFTAGRAAPNRIVVALTIDVQAPPVLTVRATARTALTVVTLDNSSPIETTELAEIASRMGPVAIYPYLREIVADVTRRSGLEPLTLPIYQIGTFFSLNPDELEWNDKAKALNKSKPNTWKQKTQSGAKSPKAKT